MFYAIGFILFVVWGLLETWDQTAFGDDTTLQKLEADATLKKLEADAKLLKSKLPEKEDDITTLVDLKFEPTELTEWYVLDLSKYNNMDLHELKQNMQQEEQRRVCAKPGSALLVKQGYRYTFHYASKEGVL